LDGNPSLNEKLRDLAMTEVNAEHKNLAKNNPVEFIRECHRRFVLKRVEAFPEMCDVARVQNILKKQELEKVGKQGKYTGSYGWSEDGQFKWDYEIPEDLYLFMQNLIYKDFWSEENGKIWRKFMKGVVSGEDPGRLLIWVKAQYGPNSQEGIVN
jgi:hypothetical protein